MKNTLETRLGVFFALALIAGFIVLELAGGAEFFKRGYRLHARFRDVQDLKVGDAVKMAGVQIGRVEAVKIDEDRVKVTFKVTQGTKVRTSSKAVIRFTGLMGQNFVSIDFGTPDGRIAEPDTLLETVEQPDLGALMAKLDNVASGIENVTKSFTGDKIDNLLGPITDFVQQNSTNLTVTFRNFKTVSERIANGEGTVGRLLADDALYVTALNSVSNLQTTAEEIKLTISDARLALADVRSAVGAAKTAMEGVNSGQGTLGKLLKDEALYNETTLAVSNLREILQKMNQGQGTVGKLINDDSFLKNVKLSLQKLDKATESLEDTGPLNVLGTAVNSLF